MNRFSSTASDFQFTNNDFQKISAFASKTYGLEIKAEKKELIYARLARRIRALSMPDFKTYCDFAMGPNPAGEDEELLSALTTNVSSFFREAHHFEFLSDVALPNLMSQIAHEEKLRLWSAGCSNGQEPYTVAAVVEKFFASRRPVDYRITATDIDLKVLARAEQGEYRGADVNGLSMQQGSALFGKAWAAAEELRVKQPLRESVEFNRLNLVERWPFREPFDVIFCRNVVIYFERRLQAELWGRFYELLRPGGYLFIGHSERLSGPADAQFEKVGITTFQKPMTA